MKTVSLKPADFGTISSATLKLEDLFDAFGHELEWQIRRNGEYFSLPKNREERDRLAGIVGEWQDSYSDDGTTLRDDEDHDHEYFLHEVLIPALETFCPAYGYFGSHPGDGADFGFWVDVENVKEQVEFSSSEDEEYPSDRFIGEWLHINERGNCTLYVRENGQNREIWAIV